MDNTDKQEKRPSNYKRRYTNNSNNKPRPIKMQEPEEFNQEEFNPEFSINILQLQQMVLKDLYEVAEKFSIEKPMLVSSSMSVVSK